MGLGCGNVSGSRFGAAGCSCLFSPAIQCRPLRPARPLPLICNAERAARASLCLSCLARALISAGREGCPVPATPGRGHALPGQCPVVFSSQLFRLPGTMRTFSPTRSKALGLGEEAGHGFCNTQRLGMSNPPLPLSCSAVDACQRAPSQPSQGRSKGCQGWRRLPSI